MMLILAAQSNTGEKWVNTDAGKIRTNFINVVVFLKVPNKCVASSCSTDLCFLSMS